MGRGDSFLKRAAGCIDTSDNLLVFLLQLSQPKFADISSVPIFFDGELQSVLHVLVITEINGGFDLLKIFIVALVVATQKNHFAQLLVIVAGWRWSHQYFY